MEKFDELRKGWIVILKTLKTMSTQDLYFLLEPDDDNKFFESVDSFKDCMEGTQFPDFQMLAIEYLLEYKKQSGPKIKTEPYIPNTGTWPFGPLDNDKIQKLTKPNTIPSQPNTIPTHPFGPIITYCGAPSYTKDNITSTSIAPDVASDAVQCTGKPACRCTSCELFDGHDMCCHHENFGSITQKTLDNCKKHNLFKEKFVW